MNCWIEFHAARIKRLQKFSDFRKDLQLSVNEALGLLGSLWGEVIELAESGDISEWTSDYVCERAGSSLNSERVWTALVKHRWVDVRPDGKHLIHDWLDYAGKYLTGKYARDNREKLVQIWSLHGRIYGKLQDPNPNPRESQGKSKGTPRTPIKVGLGQDRDSAKDGRGGEEGERKGGPEENHRGARGFFEEVRKTYPGTVRGLDPEWDNFTKKHPDYPDILPLLLPAIQRGKEYRAAAAAANVFAPAWPHFSTWLNQSRWTEEYGDLPVAKQGFGAPTATREQLEKNMQIALAGMKGANP